VDGSRGLLFWLQTADDVMVSINKGAAAAPMAGEEAIGQLN